eukprot:SAG22_NODE_17118_length_311_cov_0.726415_1_plen_67_part_01
MKTYALAAALVASATAAVVELDPRVESHQDTIKQHLEVRPILLRPWLLRRRSRPTPGRPCGYCSYML